MKVTNVGSSRQVIPIMPPPPVHIQPAGAFGGSVKRSPAGAAVSPPPAPMYTKAEAQTAMKTATDAALRRVAERIITKQYSEGNFFFRLLYGNVALRIDPTLIAESNDALAREIERARALVEDGGPFSAQTAARQVLDFVNSQASGDETKLETLRAAVQGAFENVSRMAGGTLPELTHKTYDAVMKELDIKPLAPIPASASAPASAPAQTVRRVSA
ncbi:MAG: hypothetical protein LBI44_04050 [Oscillospiraceae bacterium]|nr:hypothetical protein [Oscillospiraceae bacterium]